MKRFALLAAGACALSTAAHANDLPGGGSNQSPGQAAMSEAITRLLIDKLGEDALWQRLVGHPKRYNQTLSLIVPQHAITLGRAAFDDKVRFQVTKDVQWVENCNGTQDFTQTVETTTEVVNSYYDTQASNSESTLSHTVTLDAKVGTGLGTYVETSYSFNKTDSSSETHTTGNTQSNDKMVKETISLTAGPGESVAYQTNQVLLTGTRATFTARATINTAATLDFYVKTVGTLTPDVGVNGNYVVALDNTPVNNQPTAAADLHVGKNVLRSADGAFIFGVESGRGPDQRFGAWSVIDLNASQPAKPARLWSPVASPACATALDFVMTARGQLQLRCGSTTVWHSSNDAATSNPCFYLTFTPEAPGELICYKARPAPGVDITFVSGAIASRTMGDEIRPGLRHVKYSLAQLLPGVGSTQPVSFTGSFDGSIGVLGPIHCVVTYTAKPKPDGSGCNLLGLAGTSPNAGGRKIKTRTPSGETASISYCGPTNAFLQPYLAQNPMAVGGN